MPVYGKAFEKVYGKEGEKKTDKTIKEPLNVGRSSLLSVVP